MTHAAESTHWYGRDGSPQYTVKAKAGHDRPTNLADARKMGLVPSVTTIIKCAHAEGLQRWKLNEMLHAALTLPRGDNEAEEAWIQRVWQDSTETARKAAERGTAIHAAIQGFYEGETVAGFEPHVLGAVKAVDGWQDAQPWRAEKSFAHTSGFGGKVDLSCGVGVLDFKTKEFSDPESLKTWDEQAMQLGAYRIGLGIPTARAAIVYVSVTVPGLAKLIEIPEAELARGWRCFYSLLQFWKAKNNFDPSFEKELAA